ncbi:hypothetical protein MO973_43490 [Paenibacillus sp. TRM 82003]|nr:hypothetical protein [Paenibacillus sp. TRM 82003]
MKPLSPKEKRKDNSMAPTMEELRKLGKEMDAMKTDREMEEEAREPSPKLREQGEKK